MFTLVHKNKLYIKGKNDNECKIIMKYILLTSLLILSFAKLDYTPRRSISAVMATIENKLASKSPLEAVIRVLNEFRDAINLE